MTECLQKAFIYKNTEIKSDRIGKIWIRENKNNFSNFINNHFSNQNLKQDSKINIFHPDFNVREGEWYIYCNGGRARFKADEHDDKLIDAKIDKKMFALRDQVDRETDTGPSSD